MKRRITSALLAMMVMGTVVAAASAASGLISLGMDPKPGSSINAAAYEQRMAEIDAAQAQLEQQRGADTPNLPKVPKIPKRPPRPQAHGSGSASSPR